jgi:hypothetical protein
MKYTREQMCTLFRIYSTYKYGHRDKFCKKAEEVFSVSENEAVLIWQAFDIALEQIEEFSLEELPEYIE